MRTIKTAVRIVRSLPNRRYVDMVAAAYARGLAARVMDDQELTFAGEFDARSQTLPPLDARPRLPHAQKKMDTHYSNRRNWMILSGSNDRA
jgi:hypothetical protein